MVWVVGLLPDVVLSQYFLTIRCTQNVPTRVGSLTIIFEIIRHRFSFSMIMGYKANAYNGL